MTFTLTSTAFQQGTRIPRKHTGEGDDVSPPLSWSGLPAGTRELALVCDDPDAPRPTPWVHWVLYGLPPTLAELKEKHSGAGIEGPNDFGRTAWGGPLPPTGHGVHRYYFRLYALKEPLNAVPGWTKEKLLSQVKGRVLQVAELMGTYERK